MSKRFRSITGYPVTVMGIDESRNTVEVRVGADEPFETDDKALIDVVSGSPEVEEIKGSTTSSTQRTNEERDDAS
jgi:hypothetical protein